MVKSIYKEGATLAQVIGAGNWSCRIGAGHYVEHERQALALRVSVAESALAIGLRISVAESALGLDRH